MSFITKKRIKYFNSNDSIDDNDTEYNFSFDINLGDEFNELCVLEMRFAKSWYLVTELFGNTFTLIQDGMETVLTIPIGNYDNSKFMTDLKALLNQNANEGWVYNITFNDRLSKFNYTVTGNSSQPSFKFSDVTICEQMGFYPSQTIAFTDSQLMSECVVDFNLERSIYLKSDAVDEDEKHVLAEIYVSGIQNLASVIYRCPNIDVYSKNIVPNTKRIKFRLETDKGRRIELNGQNVLFSIVFFKRENIYASLKKFMQYIYEILDVPN